MMRDGIVSELLMPEPLIKDSESSSLPTPKSRDWKNQAATVKTAQKTLARGWNNDLAETLALLRTPAASEAERGHQPEEKAKARGGQVTLSGQINFLPTPVTTDYNTAASDWGVKGFQQLRDLHNLLPTPNTMDDLPARDESKIDRSKGGFSNVRETVLRPNFDRFEPAVRRWEEVTGRLAPQPTKPDGKDGNPRLSAEFTEWMMGLEPGWITSVGLSRKDELKACGNGVVPQQAKLAIRILLEAIDED
jgi:DNA (cytosine-5)-methyltransferase 1